MATAAVRFRSREDHRKQLELEEARKAGLAPAELDEDGNEINPHIPQYMSSAPWYLNAEKPSLKHQRNWKSDSTNSKDWYDRGAKVFQAEKFGKGACVNCGAMAHDSKSCSERPRKLGAKWTNKHIAPDEKIESFELAYDGKRDRWNGYDPTSYIHVCNSYEARDEARRRYQKEQQLQKLKGKDKDDGSKVSELQCEEEDENLEIDEAKVDDNKQMDFARVEKRVRTTGGGSTGTVRNLRIREDTAKYLLNLDVNSAHYDPKTRSMREDPLPDADPNDKFYCGDNQNRMSGQAQEFKQLSVHSWEAYGKGQAVHVQGAPSQAELLYREFKVKKESLKEQLKKDIMDKYGDAASKDKPPMELLLGLSEKQVEYDRAGQMIRGQEKAVSKSKYEEDILLTITRRYCTGLVGLEDADACVELMKANMARQESLLAAPVVQKERSLASWGTDASLELNLDPKLLKEALKGEDEKQREEKDENKRKYNVTWNDQLQCAVTSVLIFVVAANLAMGILPFVDNFAHIGGLIVGFLSGLLLLLKPQYGFVKPSKLPQGYSIQSSVKAKYNAYQYFLWITAFILLIIGVTSVAILVFQGEDGNKKCKWCHYLSCVPTSKWKCHNSFVCDEVQVGNMWQITCTSNNASTLAPLNQSDDVLQELCTQLCS
ncbi:hypothetical protein L7F22_046633 [Adiantum nelumboides]|nr:hypothetical protein [Adiantum nelumboides]